MSCTKCGKSGAGRFCIHCGGLIDEVVVGVGKGCGEIEAITTVPEGSLSSASFGAEYTQGTFRVCAPVAAADLCLSPRFIAPTTTVTINTGVDRKAAVTPLNADMFLTPEFLELFTVDSAVVGFSEVADRAIDIAARLKVAQHVVLYISSKEREMLAAEVKQNNISSYASKALAGMCLCDRANDAAKGDLSKLTINSNKTYEYVIVVRSSNFGAHRGYEVMVGEESRKFQYNLTTIEGEHPVPLLTINQILKMV